MTDVVRPVRSLERAGRSGRLAAAAARLMGKRFGKTFVATTAHCARLAEAQS
jgi:hypothetical protein